MPMKIVFLRHGIAADADGYPADDLRPLTKEGRDKTRAAARGLARLAIQPDLIVTCNLLRARETAEILAEELDGRADIQVLACLRPGGNFAEFMHWLESREEETVVAVGHMPDIAEFAQRCLTGRALFAMTFKKTAACCVEFDGEPAAGHGCLEWLLQPAILRALADR